MTVLCATCTCGHSTVSVRRDGDDLTLELHRDVMEAHADLCGGSVTEEEFPTLGEFANSSSRGLDKHREPVAGELLA